MERYVCPPGKFSVFDTVKKFSVMISGSSLNSSSNLARHIPWINTHIITFQINFSNRTLLFNQVLILLNEWPPSTAHKNTYVVLVVKITTKYYSFSYLPHGVETVWKFISASSGHLVKVFSIICLCIAIFGRNKYHSSRILRVEIW